MWRKEENTIEFNIDLIKKYLKRKIILLIIFLGIVIILLGCFFYAKKDSDEIIAEDILIDNQNTIQESVKNTNTIKVHVAGCVQSQGIIELEEGSRIADAIDKVGGLTANASTKNVNLAYVLQDGEKIYIPSLAEEQIADEEIQIISSASGSNDNGKVNINKASITELQKISGIGESTAKKIIEYRNTNGKFKSIEDLKNIQGIGDKKYDSIKEEVTV